ncbi:hypothetical protein N656DRAFT_800888 [Canariomyces notabilis]|uniref:Uncharacterized protein n=1 Tax=Canariomyces notabilis TaxID=2074819 RepID=A0AAN6QNC2_9PEZI|nr:hypothetical protein N656DRAFT_800888 [Canariomyces arenarius]
MQVVTTIWTVLAVFFLPQLKLDPTRDYVIVVLVAIQGGLSVVLVILMVPSSTFSFHWERPGRVEDSGELEKRAVKIEDKGQ